MTPGMYTAGERADLRNALLDLARADPRITGAAITGSASVDREDAWSDIDLAFGVRSADEIPAALADLTAHMYARYGALHQVDVLREPWIYRVFILPSTLQVDLAFAPADAFRARARSFRLVFGAAQEPAHVPPPAAEGRGMDALPADITTPLRDALVRSFDPLELMRAMAVAVRALVREIDAVDPALAARLGGVLDALIATAHPA